METPGAGAPRLSIAPERCVNTRHRDLDCQRCQQSCPTVAILSTRPLKADASRCASCGLCASICPVEAISVTGPSDLELLRQMRGLLDEDLDLELACRRAVQSGQAGRGCQQVLQMNCLARLPGVVLAAAMSSARGSIWVNDIMCRDCVLGRVRANIRTAVDEARAIAQGLGIHDKLVYVTDRETRPTRTRRRLFGGSCAAARVTRSGEQSLSRRELFTAFRQRSFRSGGTSTLTESETSAPGRQLSQRRRVLAQLVTIGLETADISTPLSGSSVGQPVLTAACSGCGVCAKACPTSALHFRVQGHEGILDAEALRCVSCGACVKACSAQALAVKNSAPISALSDGAATVLWRGDLVPCSRCGGSYHQVDGTSELCPLCSFLQSRRGSFVAASP